MTRHTWCCSGTNAPTGATSGGGRITPCGYHVLSSIGDPFLLSWPRRCARRRVGRTGAVTQRPTWDGQTRTGGKVPVVLVGFGPSAAAAAARLGRCVGVVMAAFSFLGRDTAAAGNRQVDRRRGRCGAGRWPARSARRQDD